MSSFSFLDCLLKLISVGARRVSVFVPILFRDIGTAGPTRIIIRLQLFDQPVQARSGNLQPVRCLRDIAAALRQRVSDYP